MRLPPPNSRIWHPVRFTRTAFAELKFPSDCYSLTEWLLDHLKILVAFCQPLVRFRGPRFEMSRGRRCLADESSAVDKYLGK
jgi:hypothetical protein